MLTDLTALIPPAWREIVDLDRLRQISKEIGSDFIPDPKLIFRSVECAPSDVKVVIVGQDPYPTPGYATGLAFSVSPQVTKLPASLKNIFTEYVSDTGFGFPANGDLSNWADNGVALMNSSLTLNLDNKSEHLKIGWQRITSAALDVLASHGAVAILWGSHAQKMGSEFQILTNLNLFTPARFRHIEGSLAVRRSRVPMRFCKKRAERLSTGIFRQALAV